MSMKLSFFCVFSLFCTGFVLKFEECLPLVFYRKLRYAIDTRKDDTNVQVNRKGIGFRIWEGFRH